MSHLVYSAAASFLVAAFVSSPITLSTDNTRNTKWRCLSSQASRYFPFLSTRYETGFCVGVFHHSMLRLCQQLKCRRHTSYREPIIQSLLYPHRSQHPSLFPLHRDPPFCPVSVHPSLYWELILLLPQPHAFWVSRSLHQWCTLSHTYPPTLFSGDCYGYLQAPPSCNVTYAPP